MEYQEFGFIDSMPPNWLPSLSLLWQQFQSFLCNLTSRKVDLCDTQPSETYWEPSRMFLSSILYFICALLNVLYGQDQQHRAIQNAYLHNNCAFVRHL